MRKLSAIERAIIEVREKNYVAIILNNNKELVKVSCHFLEPCQKRSLKLFLNKIFKRSGKIDKLIFIGNRQTKQTQLVNRYYERALNLEIGKEYRLVRLVSSDGEILEGNHILLN